MTEPDVRQGMPAVQLDRAEFEKRYRSRFIDPAFRSDWLTDMKLISAGGMAETDGYIGYMKPYATSHAHLDEDTTFQTEVVNVAQALAVAMELARTGSLEDPGRGWWTLIRSSP